MPATSRASPDDGSSRPRESDAYFYALPHLSIAGIALRQKRYDEAEGVARLALRVLRDALPAGHFVTAVAECRLARALVGQRRHGEAELLFDASSGVLVASESLPDYREECLLAAASFFEQRGHPERAAPLRQALGGG